MKWIALLTLLLCGRTLAAGHPPILPTRDVDVIYRVAQPVEGGPPLSQRMRWSIARSRLRIDPPSPALYMIVDYAAKQLAVVKPVERAVLDVPTGVTGLPGAPGGSFTRQDGAIVAGLRCTNWRTADAAGEDTQLCLTSDGVTLRAVQKGQVLLEAVSVAYGPQDPAAFDPPTGFRHVAGSTR